MENWKMAKAFSRSGKIMEKSWNLKTDLGNTSWNFVFGYLYPKAIFASSFHSSF